MGGHPLAAPVGEVARGQQFAQLGIDQGMAAIGAAPTGKQLPVLDPGRLAVLQATGAMEGGAVALLRPEEKLAPEQLLLEPVGALIGALAGLVLEQHLPNPAHGHRTDGQKGRELRGELGAHQAVAAGLVVAQAIGAATEVLEPGQGRGLIAPEGEGAAGVALGIPVRL